MKNFENKPVLENKIEYNNNELTFCPKKGGLIKSMKIEKGGETGDKKVVELFYFDEERFNDLNKSDRGGAPVLFPMAGPKTEEGPFSKLNQHGFARDLPWEILKNENGKFVEILKSNDETTEDYPYNFELRMKSEINEGGDITLTQEVENTGTKEMPVSMGLHPYFNVPEEDKENIKFNFSGGKDLEEKIQKWLVLDKQDKDYGAFMERIDNPGEEIEMNIPGIGTIKMDISKEYEKVWIWTERGSKFICIEPVMRDNDNGEIVGGPEMVKGGETFSASVKYSLEK